MKVLVSVVGIGLGHATRCEAIVKALQKRRVKVKIVTWGDAYRFLSKRGLEPENTGGYDYKGDEYSFSVMLNILDSFRDPTKLKRDYYKFVKLADSFKPDKILSDTDPNAFFYAHRRNLPNYMISNLNTTMNSYDNIPKELRTRDLMLQNFMIKRLMDHITKRTNRIFVPSFEPKIRYKENIRYTDLIIRKRASELASETQLRKKLGIDREFYLVSIGGAEIEKHLFQVLRKTLPEFKDKYFVVSSNYEVKKPIKEENMTIMPFIPNILEYLKIAKGVIGPAGHSTISESICYNKPIMVIPITNHVEQLANAALLEKEGLGQACFIKQKLNANILKASLEEFFKKEDKIKKKLELYAFKGKGADEIAKVISTS